MDFSNIPGEPGVRVYRETTGADGDRWEIQTDYGGTVGTGAGTFRTIIARR